MTPLHLASAVATASGSGLWTPPTLLRRQPGDEAGRQTAADRMQLQFGDGALEAQQQTPVGAAGIVDAVAIGDQTATQPANIQQGIPVGAVAREPRHIDGQDHAHFAEPHPADKLLKPAAMGGRGAAEA